MTQLSAQMTFTTRCSNIYPRRLCKRFLGPSVSSGTLVIFPTPDSWRTSTVIPVPKPGKDKSDSSNYRPIALTSCICKTRSSADADNRLDAFSGQSRSTNMVPFHMLHIVSYCAIVTLSLSEVFTIFVFKKIHDLEMGVKGHSRSLRVVSFDRLCMVCY